MDASLQRFCSITQCGQNRFWSCRFGQLAATLACTTVLALGVSVASAADFRTRNFIVMAPTPELARSVGESAETFRRDLAVYWLGGELAPWPTPCPVRVIAGHNLAAQGVTTYNRAPVRDFQMEVVGSPQRILDSVLPHEVTHTILATYFGRPLPRWADEGICTTVEHISERQKHEAKLREFLRSRRGIAMNKLFLLTEYPSDVLPMYAQGYSVCQFLIAQNGPRAFVGFLGDYMKNPSWTHNVRNHYGYDSLAELQQSWLGWVSDGSGPVDAFVKNVASPTPSAPEIVTASLAGTPLPAATQSNGWYSRLRDEAISGKPASDASLGASPIAAETTAADSAWPRSLGPAPPTSVSPVAPAQLQHSVAQPQPEQGMSPNNDFLDAPQYRPGSLATGGTSWR